jgi:hypothetical protein
VDDTQCLTFRSEARVLVQVIQDFISSLQHCPKAYFPLLPDVTELERSESSYSALEDSDISLLRYFSGPTATMVTLFLIRWLAYSSAKPAVLADLPSLCPNVASFAAMVGSPRIRTYSKSR